MQATPTTPQQAPRITLVYIHGAGASQNSLRWLQEQMGSVEYDEVQLSYENENGFMNNVAHMEQALQGYDNLFFIAHSLGGVYAAHLAGALPDKVLGAVTMGTPYGGCKHVAALSLFWPCQLFNDIGQHSLPIARGLCTTLPGSWVAIVTTKGRVPWMTEDNDGVVTKKSMMAHPHTELYEVDATHHEVVLSPCTIDIIRLTLAPLSAWLSEVADTIQKEQA